MNLFELLKKQDELALQVAEAGGQLLNGMELVIDQAELAVASKVDGYHYAMERLALEAERFSKEAQALKSIADRLTGTRELIKDRLKGAMLIFSKAEVSGERHRFLLAKGQKKLVLDQDVLGQEWKTQVVTWVPDKERIRFELEAGRDVEGARLEDVHVLRTYPARKS